MQILRSEQELKVTIPNIGLMLQRNVKRFGDRIAYQEKGRNGNYVGISWIDLYRNIENIAFNLSSYGFSKQDKIVLFSKNRLEMLELELAVMALGGIAVPIFSNFNKETAELLINHSDSNFLAVGGESQLANISQDLKFKSIFIFDELFSEEFLGVIPFKDLLKDKTQQTSKLDFELAANTICLNMYTSGTMGTPKCVQLTHKNILSQQAALDIIWNIDENDRFLSYLPWHHSFGGIFELFTALYSGATYSLEDSYGTNPESIMENWRLVKPTVFFSVPKVYKSLVDLTKKSQEAKERFFNSGLKFIFTAAAALPQKISNEFENRGIPVIEGWGLTETSPCCSLTDPTLKREEGVVGKPIPGVSVRIAEDNEIQVKGPNVMVSYYNNDEANKSAFTEDGWYRTGDVGKINENGIQLVSRKDRIFKLSNGEKVIPTDLEKIIELKCHYVQYVIVSGRGEDQPVALIFPNKNLLVNPDYELTPDEGCFCPRNLNELGKCLQGCLHDVNADIKRKFSKLKSVALVDDELSLDDMTLTPSMKMAPNNVLEKYKSHLSNMYGKNVPINEEVYVVELDAKNKPSQKIVQN